MRVGPGGTRYRFCPAELAWTDAAGQCGAIGETLVQIGDAEEMAWVQRHARARFTAEFWLGATDDATEGVFVWTLAQTQVDSGYAPWAPAQPSNGGALGPDENCLAGQLDGEWDDLRCSADRAFVCEGPAP